MSTPVPAAAHEPFIRPLQSTVCFCRHWGRLKGLLEASADGDNLADGAAAGHTCAARHEAALRLITNHAAVIRDVTRPDGAPPSQPQLKRLPKQRSAVDSPT